MLHVQLSNMIKFYMSSFALLLYYSTSLMFFTYYTRYTTYHISDIIYLQVVYTPISCIVQNYRINTYYYIHILNTIIQHCIRKNLLLNTVNMHNILPILQLSASKCHNSFDDY